MEVIEASLIHLDGIVRLNKFVQDFHAEHEPDCFRSFDESAVREYLMGALKDPSVRVLLAMERTDLLGYVLVREGERVENAYSRPRRFLDLEHIVVRPDRRRNGIGALLIDAALNMAHTMGAGNMELSVWQFNDSARRLFEKKGFEPVTQRMRRRVP